MSTQMLSVAGPADAVRQLLAGRSNIFLSHENAPDQTVVAGEAGEVQAFAAQLRSAGFESRPLAVPRAFHTPLMAGAQPPFAAALEKSWIVPPRTAFMSSVSGRLVSDPVEIRANLVAQLTAPVNYVELIRRLSQSGASVLVEVGPQQVLTRLHRRILGDAAVSIASDHPKRTSEQQLCRLLAQLECAGAARRAGSSRSTGARSRRAIRIRCATQFVSFDATTRRKARLRGDSVQDNAAVSRSRGRSCQSESAPRNRLSIATEPSPSVVAAETNGHSDLRSHVRQREWPLARGAGIVSRPVCHRPDRLSAGDRAARCRLGGRSGHRQHQEGPIVRRARRIF